MNQLALAHIHYWTLRKQGKAPGEAASHVFQRFGVFIDHIAVENAADNAEQTVRNPDMPWPGYGEGFRETTWGTSTGPVDDLRAGVSQRYLACGGEYCEGDESVCDGTECEK